jgi:Tfp pilus assembly protein PilO
MNAFIERLLKQLENLKNNKQRLILVALFGLLIAYADIAVILKGELAWVGSTNSKVTKLEKGIIAVHKDLVNLESRKTLQAKTLSQAKTIITEDQRQVAFEYIYDTANKYEVKIVQLKPSMDMKAKGETMDKIKLVPVLLNLDLVCGYHNLGAFMNALENGKYFFAVTQMRITRNSSDSFRHNVSAVLKTYVKK